jgi:hypothetical protein
MVLRNASVSHLVEAEDALQDQPAKVMLLQQVPEPQDGCLIRRGSDAKIHADESAHRSGLIQQLLHTRVRQVEPLLHKVPPQHDRKTHWLPSVACLRIVRPRQRLQPGPWNHLLHLVQEKLPTALPSVLLKHSLTRQTPLLHRSSPHCYQTNQPRWGRRTYAESS